MAERGRDRKGRKHLAFYTAVIVGVVGLLMSLLLLPRYAVAIGANLMFVTYLVLVARELPRLTPQFLRKRADDADAPVGAIFLVTAMTVAVAVIFLFRALNDPGGRDLYAVIASAVSVILGWFAVHTLAAMHYAHEYYEPPPIRGAAAAHEISGGLNFPSEDEPAGVDFVYFAYVIGMTAQVADVAVSSRPMRKLVAMHGVFAFFFNAVIVAATVNVVVALAGK